MSTNAAAANLQVSTIPLTLRDGSYLAVEWSVSWHHWRRFVVETLQL